MISLAAASASPGPVSRLVPGSDRTSPDPAETDMRLLRHQTKNALMRMLLLIEEHPDVQGSEAGRALAADLHRRIALTAAISDALFGLTRAPEPLARRLRLLCESVVALLGGAEQEIRLGVGVEGDCPPALHGVVLRVAHEFVMNAVRHGLYARVGGRIEVTLEAGGGEVRLTVADDGWGCAGQPGTGEGLSLSRLLATRAGGSVALDRRDGRTVAALVLPWPDAAATG